MIEQLQHSFEQLQRSLKIIGPSTKEELNLTWQENLSEILLWISSIVEEEKGRKNKSLLFFFEILEDNTLWVRYWKKTEQTWINKHYPEYCSEEDLRKIECIIQSKISCEVSDQKATNFQVKFKIVS